jgi:predicted sulfurtransferase
MSTEGSQATAAAASAMSQKYHSMFPEVVSLTSHTLINDTISKATEDTPQWNIDGQQALLVDVRSQPERKVSMISGAISLNELKTKVLPNLIDKASDDAPSNIVLYCTIGLGWRDKS